MDAEQEKFFFSWKIENFSLCPQQKGTYLKSPSFFIGSLERTKWHLRLYPRGKKDETTVCEISRESDTGPNYVFMNYQFSFAIGAEPYEFKASSYDFQKEGSTLQKLSKNFQCLLKDSYLFLPKDTMHISCKFWRESSKIEDIKYTPAVTALVNCLYDEKDDDKSYPVPEELYTTTGHEIIELKKKLYPYLNKCSARTRLGLERRSFIWPIKSIITFKLNQCLSVPLVCPAQRSPRFVLKLSLKEPEKFQVDIRKLVDDYFECIFVKGRLAVIDVNGREYFSLEDEHFFRTPKSEEVWTFPSFFGKKQLLDAKAVCLPNDILSLRCCFTISANVEFSGIEECNYISLDRKNLSSASDMGTLAEDLKSLYIDRKLFDVDLCVEGQTFKAHLAVLASRSPVFSAMFEHDTEEKKTKSVKIIDVDAETMKLMLEFMYSDSVPDLQSLGAIKLYSAADKYQITSLKDKCSLFLASNLCPGNVGHALVLADVHQDKELKEAVYEYLFKPPYEILFSSEFEEFMGNSTALALETLRRWIQRLKFEASQEIV